MPRISQDQTQERQAFLLELFRSQPDLSRQEAMDAFKQKFGATINLKTLTQLRDQVQEELATKGVPVEEPSSSSASASDDPEEPARDEEDDKESSSEDAASRLKAAAGAPESMNGASSPQKPKPAKGARQRNVFVDAPKEHLDFLQRIVSQLQEAGASNVRIDHSTDRWMVLVVDAK